MIFKKIWLVIPILVIASSCGTSTSITSSVGCTGYMLVENNHYKKVSSKKRENKVKNSEYSIKKGKKRVI